MYVNIFYSFFAIFRWHSICVRSYMKFVHGNSPIRKHGKVNGSNWAGIVYVLKSVSTNWAAFWHQFWLQNTDRRFLANVFDVRSKTYQQSLRKQMNWRFCNQHSIHWIHKSRNQHMAMAIWTRIRIETGSCTWEWIWLQRTSHQQTEKHSILVSKSRVMARQFLFFLV